MMLKITNQVGKVLLAPIDVMLLLSRCRCRAWA